MRPIIRNNVHLQPDHFSFQREAALQLLDDHARGEPIFGHTYLTFIGIFESIRTRLASFHLSPSDDLNLAKATIAWCMAQGHLVFTSLDFHGTELT
jgi:hypothetical protein